MEKSSTTNIAYAIGFERMNFFVRRFVCSDISITSLVSFIVSIFKHVIIHMIFVRRIRIRPDEMIWNSACSFLFHSFRHPLPKNFHYIHFCQHFQSDGRGFSSFSFANSHSHLQLLRENAFYWFILPLGWFLPRKQPKLSIHLTT